MSRERDDFFGELDAVLFISKAVISIFHPKRTDNQLRESSELDPWHGRQRSTPL